MRKCIFNLVTVEKAGESVRIKGSRRALWTGHVRYEFWVSQGDAEKVLGLWSEKKIDESTIVVASSLKPKKHSNTMYLGVPYYSFINAEMYQQVTGPNKFAPKRPATKVGPFDALMYKLFDRLPNPKLPD